MTTSWLLDTNVLSELRRPKPDGRAVAFAAAQPLDRLHVGTVTFAEIRFGIESGTDAGERAESNAWLAHEVRPMFEHRVLSVTEEVMFTWRLLVETGRKAGHTFSQPDLIIAATALHHGMTVVTRDAGDVARTGTAVLDPWKAVPETSPAEPLRGSARCVPQPRRHVGGRWPLSKARPGSVV